MSELILRSAKIAFFLPRGHAKAHDTKVSVRVGAKLDDQADFEIAQKLNFAGRDPWEDDGQHIYTYGLDVVPTELAQISGTLKTTISIQPESYNTVKFDYKLTLLFHDEDPNTASIKMTQQRRGIMLDQNHSIFHSWCIFTKMECSAHADYSVGEVDW